MAKSVKERCDVIIGSGGQDFMAIAGYKVGEGTDQEEGRYAYGVYFNYPDFDKITKADRDKLFTIAIDRVRSVSQAPFKAKILAEEITQAEIEAWAASVDGENFLTFLNTVKEKKAPVTVDTLATATLAELAAHLRDKMANDTLKNAKVPFPGPAPLDKNGKVNFRAWAKMGTQHPWYIQIYDNKKKAGEKLV